MGKAMQRQGSRGRKHTLENKKYRNGQTMICKFCESEYHLWKDCWEWRELEKEMRRKLMEKKESLKVGRLTA